MEPQTAWERYRPSNESPWDAKKVGHLYRRAAFGASWGDIETALREGPDRTIDALLQGRPDPDGDPVWTVLSRSVRQSNNGDQLAPLWLYRMLYSTHPLREKLTLFWHNHFATSNAKVQNADYMLSQYDLMREHAQGNFRTLLQQISRDRAMLVWLDTNQSQRNRPNENYARELMELFTLGITNVRRPGERNYTEPDIREAARAFTGWRIVQGRAVFQETQHDNTEKNVFGQRGRWRADDIVRICLDQEAASYFIVRKLFTFLVSETVNPTPDLLEPLATEFRQNYDFGALVGRILRSNLFFAPSTYRTKVKSPVDFVLGIIRGLEANRTEADQRGGIGTAQLALAMEGLGQKLFYPPSVAGWNGGRAWLNGQTFLLRQNLALALTSTTDDRFGRRADPAPLLSRHRRNQPNQQVDFFLRLFLENEVPASARQRLADFAAGQERLSVPPYWTTEDTANHRVRSLCHMLLCLPEFQLG